MSLGVWSAKVRTDIPSPLRPRARREERKKEKDTYVHSNYLANRTSNNPQQQGQRTRALHVAVPPSPGTLGLSLQWTPLAAASENVWHVLDVAANSPADAAGLLPYGDYVLGSPDGALLHGEAALGELVDAHVNDASNGRPLRLWVYNHEYDVAREVEVVPSREWGGEGALGCVLGYGALHRLPAPLSEPIHAPGETMFDYSGDSSGTAGAGGDGGPPQFTTLAPPAMTTAPPPPLLSPSNGNDTFTAPPPPALASSSDFLIPAQMVSPPPTGSTSTPPPGATRGARRKDHNRPGHSPNRLDDYFAEQEKKSKELEGGSISASKTPPPPPPKAGSAGIPPPPRATPKPPQTAAAATSEEESSGGDGSGDGSID